MSANVVCVQPHHQASKSEIDWVHITKYEYRVAICATFPVFLLAQLLTMAGYFPINCLLFCGIKGSQAHGTMLYSTKVAFRATGNARKGSAGAK